MNSVFTNYRTASDCSGGFPSTSFNHVFSPIEIPAFWKSHKEPFSILPQSLSNTCLMWNSTLVKFRHQNCEAKFSRTMTFHKAANFGLLDPNPPGTFSLFKPRRFDVTFSRGMCENGGILRRGNETRITFLFVQKKKSIDFFFNRSVY